MARVVAIREPSGIGIAVPLRQAAMKRWSSVRWPLSWPLRALLVLRFRPAQTLAWVKLSSRALQPPAAASSVSLGKRGLPVVR